MLERRDIPRQGETWRHYKGNEYEIVGVGNHTENDQQLVAYRLIGSSTLWFRPLRMFMSPIGDATTPRFARLADVVQFQTKPVAIVDRDPGDETQAA